MKKKTVVFFVFALLLSNAIAQDIRYVKKLIDTLASPAFHGRGYVENGNRMAADYIVKELGSCGLLNFGKDYLQEFTFPMNTFPGKMELRIGEKQLTPATDYVVNVASKGLTGTFPVKVLDQKTLKSEKSTWNFNNSDLTGTVLLIDTGFTDRKNTKLQSAMALLEISDSPFIWSVAGAEETLNHPKIKVLRSALPKKFKEASFDISNEYVAKYPTQNVCGYIRGSAVPDSFIVFTAHYDHLGEMGKGVMFPGANDNASGTAMLLDLAKFYADTVNRPYYSVAFIFFTGEEAGLYGSEYYTMHPLFPLQQIKFLVNLDMVGTGSEGIKVVNGSIFTEKFSQLKRLNDEGRYVKAVSPRAESSGSDHYYFYKNGIPCFFIYTLGKDYKEYHNINDKAAGLPLTAYDGLFKLVTAFVKGIHVAK